MVGQRVQEHCSIILDRGWSFFNSGGRTNQCDSAGNVSGFDLPRISDRCRYWRF